MTFFKWFVIVSIVSLHGLVALVAYEQRVKTEWLNKKINTLYRTHRLRSKSFKARCVFNKNKKIIEVQKSKNPRSTKKKTPKCYSL